MLPANVPHFTGRAAELDALTEAMDNADRAPGTVVISAIGGTAGVGKTALALYWGHQSAARFPDGQLYVNLRGFGPSGTPVTAAEAIRGFLDVLAVPAAQVPPDLAAQAGLYRTRLTGRRMLIVLDNARDEQQVRPLLPASSGCLVLVTSRSQLAGLAASNGARLLNLDALPEAEARQMLADRLGAGRAAAEPDAMTEITDLCARLPLALAVAAARADMRPGFPLSALAAELREAQSRLDVLDTGDPASSVRAVLSWSAAGLSSAAARMFRLLGLHPGPDISVPAAASLAAATPAEAHRLLHELTRDHLLNEHVPGRYTFHDLLRAYATEQAEATEDQETRRAAAERLLDYYLHTAYGAAMVLSPHREPVDLAVAVTGVEPEPIADLRQAMSWFEAECGVLPAVIAQAAETGFDAYAWQLAWTMATFLDRRGYWHEWAAIQRIAVAAAARLDDTAGEAVATRLLGSACARAGDLDGARTSLEKCLGLYGKLGDRSGQARAHQILGWAAERQGQLDQALAHAEQALLLLEAAGNQVGQADALNTVGWYHAVLGDSRRAREFCQQALALRRSLGDRHGEAGTWDTLGYAEHQLGNLAGAVICYENALGLYRELGDRLGESTALTHLGDSLAAAGHPERARQAWQQALDILDDLHYPDADHVRAKLAGSRISE